MILIGENIHIISKTVRQALEEKDENTLLYVSADLYAQNQDNLVECQVVYNNEQWLLIRK